MPNLLHCIDCLGDPKIFCKRDPDARCLHCGKELCGAHIITHLQRAHYISITLDHCSKRRSRDEKD